MRRERSQQIARQRQDLRRPTGTLYVVGMPIGDPDDVTIRALDILRHADVIASEDPVVTRTVLTHHRIHTPITSYGPNHLHEKVAILIHRLQQGARIALVSDCGSPVIADPGCLLIQSAHNRGIRVMSVPGASAVTTAIAVSGMSGDSFFFQGKLPETRTALNQRVTRLLTSSEPFVVFTTANSLHAFLSRLMRVAPRRRVVAACNLTMPGEMIIGGMPRQVHRALTGLAIYEVTLIVKGKPRGKSRARKINPGRT